MSDLVTALPELVEKIGLALATICGLVLALRWLSQQHLKALNTRITTLEAVIKQRDAQLDQRDKVIAELNVKIDGMHKERLSAAIGYAHDMKSIAMQLMENDRLNREVQRALMTRLDSRPCLLDPKHPDYPPHPEIPETERTQRHA